MSDPQPVEHYPIFVAGRFEATGDSLDVINPFTRQCVYRSYLADASVLDRALDAAMDARPVMQDLPIYLRSRILRETAQGIRDQRRDLALIMAREAAKPLATALAETDRAADTFSVAAEEVKRLPGEVLSIDWTPHGHGKEAVVGYFPIGVVAGIAPFNFPLNLVAHKIAPAIAAGCPIVLKPASKTPISALSLAGIIDRAGLPKGALSVLPMDRNTGNRLVTDERIKLLSFTGSPEVGWDMKKNAGRKKVVLELGGNAAMIVAADADLDDAAVKAVAGAFSYAGQSCIHTQRIYVDITCFDAFVEKFLRRMARLRIGDPEHPATDVSVMIDLANAERIEAWVAEAEQGGAVIMAGGTREGNLYAPTLLTGTRKSMKVCALEAFAPVVAVEPFDDFKKAVDAVNDSTFGLQAGVFTFDSRKIHYAFRNLEVGGVLINEAPTFRADHMPYGGVKDSGLGREGPKYAILDMLEPRILVTDRTSEL
ncbi:MAG: aldehyde dehydrogenase family protein [Gammaproteobacteria bacterium]